MIRADSIIIGINVAEAVVWATMVTMLATINFTKARDSEGHEITPKVEHVGEGLVRYAPYSIRHNGGTEKTSIGLGS